MKKTLIFYDKDFPGYTAWNFEIDSVEEQIDFCSAADLKDSLSRDYHVFVNTHGSYFPQDAAEAIYHHLKKGKGFVNLYDTPFVYPCNYGKNGVWIPQKAKSCYYRRLNIHSVMRADQGGVTEFLANDEFSIGENLAQVLSKTQFTRNFVLIPTKDKYIEEEWGSSGSMDARVYPLVMGMAEKEHITSPVILIENRSGEYSGGRWIFVNGKICEDKNTNSWLIPLVGYVARGYRELMVKPSAALFFPGEKPVLKLQTESFGKECSWEAEIECLKDDMMVCHKKERVEGLDIPIIHHIPLDIKTEPGLYHIKVTFCSDDGEIRSIRQGFCVRDEELLHSLKPFTCGRDYMKKDGICKPIIGTTYMSGEVSRSFLHLPNPSNWYADMQEMKNQGITWIRTGMWCNWRTYMLDDGHFEESILRSVDAFIQTAAMLGLHVTMTFFTFVPESFEGSHPYLDVRSLKAQKRFITNVVSRHRNTTNVDWDLINEPFTTDHPTQKKKDCDTLEQADFQKFMGKKYQTVENMADQLDLCTDFLRDFSDLTLPDKSQINFDITDMGDSKNGLIWKDYVCYTVEMFQNWLVQMRDAIKKINETHMVTVGQDEALRGQRPTPLLYGGMLDYNCQHTWWLLDDLVWDTKFTKYQGKPLIVQETGVMYAEMPNNIPARSETDISNLLQKKYAYAFGTGCGGTIQWIWNTNYYLKSANESNIGAIRCDGSRKPEFYLYKHFAEFFEKAAGSVSDIRTDSKIAVVFPFTNDFSNRNFAQHATSQITKILTCYLKQDFIGISEFDLSPIWEQKPKVIFVPSAHHFREESFLELIKAAEEIGSTIVFTGPISLNENFDNTKRAEIFVGQTRMTSLGRFADVCYQKQKYRFSFDNQYSIKAFKESSDGENDMVREVPLGKGSLLWIGVPVDLSASQEEIARLYGAVLENKNVKSEIVLENGHPGVFASKLKWENASLFTLVNETGANHRIVLTDTVTGKKYSFELLPDGCFLFIADKQGNLVSVYQNQSIAVS